MVTPPCRSSCLLSVLMPPLPPIVPFLTRHLHLSPHFPFSPSLTLLSVPLLRSIVATSFTSFVALLAHLLHLPVILYSRTLSPLQSRSFSLPMHSPHTIFLSPHLLPLLPPQASTGGSSTPSPAAMRRTSSASAQMAPSPPKHHSTVRIRVSTTWWCVPLIWLCRPSLASPPQCRSVVMYSCFLLSCILFPSLADLPCVGQSMFPHTPASISSPILPLHGF